jgi:hypothetical protein
MISMLASLNRAVAAVVIRFGLFSSPQAVNKTTFVIIPIAARNHYKLAPMKHGAHSLPDLFMLYAGRD